MTDHGPAIRAYFESCNGGDEAQIAAHFTDGAVIYDTNHGPVATAAGIGRFWLRIRSQWQGAVWQVDSVVSDGDAAAIEWRMSGTADHGRFVFRGSEHYRFQGPLIDEIRQYWNFDTQAVNTGLIEYPYGETPDRLPADDADNPDNSKPDGPDDLKDRERAED